jgi:hypothetical protein
MVHALQRARRHLRAGGAMVVIQPDQWKRPSIALSAPQGRQPVAALINPAFQTAINAAVAAIETSVERGLFVKVSNSNHRFRVRLSSLAELHRYLRQGQRPPRFPPGGRKRLRDLWRRRPPDTQVEVTEFFTIIGLRATRR